MTTDLLAPPALHPRLRLPSRVLAGLLALLAIAGSGLGVFAFFASGGPSAVLLPPSLGLAALAILLAIAAGRGHDPLMTYAPKGAYMSLVWAAAMGDSGAEAEALSMHASDAQVTKGAIPFPPGNPKTIRKRLLTRVRHLSDAIRAIDAGAPTRGFDDRARARAHAALRRFHTLATEDLTAFDRRVNAQLRPPVS
jgi:hypothetical protein